MSENLKSELSVTTRKYLELVEEISGIESSANERSNIVLQYFYQLVNELLDQTSDYLKRNNILNTDRCTEIVQSELERFIHDAVQE